MARVSCPRVRAAASPGGGMAQAQGVSRGLPAPAPCSTRAPARSRTRARAVPDGRSGRFEELFADDVAGASKRGSAKKHAAATQPPPTAASVLSEAPPPSDAQGTATVGVQAAAAFFAIGLVWQLWPLIKLCVLRQPSRVCRRALLAAR